MEATPVIIAQTRDGGTDADAHARLRARDCPRTWRPPGRPRRLTAHHLRQRPPHRPQARARRDPGSLLRTSVRVYRGSCFPERPVGGVRRRLRARPRVGAQRGHDTQG